MAPRVGLSYSRPTHIYLSYHFTCLGRVYLYLILSSLYERPLELNLENPLMPDASVMPTLSPFLYVALYCGEKPGTYGRVFLAAFDSEKLLASYALLASLAL